MKKGKISEIGNHESLLREHPDGVYAKLVRQQQDADENKKESDDDVKLNADNDDYKTDQSNNERL